jgi:diacylglycerol kinase family enzyme
LFHGDGEILGPTPVEIEVVPRAVRVLAPAAP